MARVSVNITVSTTSGGENAGVDVEMAALRSLVVASRAAFGESRNLVLRARLARLESKI